MKQLKLNGLEPVKRTLVFDIETQRGFGETRQISEMGVAAAVSYDCLAREYKVYTEENIQELIEDIFNSDIVVGYNVIQFDYNVLKGYTNRDFKTLKTVDMMRIVEKPLGFRPKLNNLVAATLGESKSADGLQSLIWYRQGKIDKVIEYCKQDVKVTKDLYEFGRDNGFVLATTLQGQVRVPVEW